MSQANPGTHFDLNLSFACLVLFHLRNGSTSSSKKKKKKKSKGGRKGKKKDKKKDKKGAKKTKKVKPGLWCLNFMFYLERVFICLQETARSKTLPQRMLAVTLLILEIF